MSTPPPKQAVSDAVTVNCFRRLLHLYSLNSSPKRVRTR